MRVIKWLDKNFEFIFMCGLLAIMTVVMFVQVVARYIFDSAMHWPEELCRYCFVTSVWFCCSYSVRYRTNLRIDSLLTVLPKKAAFVLDIFVDIVTIAVYAAFFYGSYQATMNSYALGSATPAMGMPQWIVYMFMPIGFGISILRGIQTIILKFIERRKENEEPEEVEA